MTNCLVKSCSFGLLCVSHRRNKVLNIRGGGGGGGGGAGKAQNIGRGANFSLADRSPRPQSVPNNYISHTEN